MTKLTERVQEAGAILKEVHVDVSCAEVDVDKQWPTDVEPGGVNTIKRTALHCCETPKAHLYTLYALMATQAVGGPSSDAPAETTLPLPSPPPKLISLAHIKTSTSPAAPTPKPRLSWPGGVIKTNKDEAVARFLQKKVERGEGLTAEQQALFARFHADSASAVAAAVAAAAVSRPSGSSVATKRAAESAKQPGSLVVDLLSTSLDELTARRRESNAGNRRPAKRGRRRN